MSDPDISERNIVDQNPLFDDTAVFGAAAAVGEQDTADVDTRHFRRQFTGTAMDDIVLVSPQSEIEKTLTHRFQNKVPYTYQGALLLSINPFAAEGTVASTAAGTATTAYSLFGNGVKALYHESHDPYHLSPHVYTIAETSYRGMCQHHEDQVIVVSGESGSGKTFSTSKLLSYLSKISISSDVLQSRLQKAILGSVPLLEAFGNAATRVNDNSSRFGKLIELFFDNVSHQLTGGQVLAYMLEKSRLTNHRQHERNFHIVHQLASNDQMMDEIIGQDTLARLRAAGQQQHLFRYIPPLQSGDSFQAINDKEGWKQTRKCMSMVGLSDLEVTEVSRCVYGILVLGNVQFRSAPGTSAGQTVTEVANPEILESVARIWQVPSDNLKQALCYRTITTRGETTRTIQDVPKAESNRDSLARAVYERLFHWIVSRINKSIAGSQTEAQTTGEGKQHLVLSLLDFMGFEIGQQNSFDQLNINWVNEKIFGIIQQSIRQELEECAREGVDQGISEAQSVRVGGGFNSDECINLIESKPIGIYSLLDEESVMPKGNDKQYLQKLGDNVGKQQGKPKLPKVFDLVPQHPMTFSLLHSAAKVAYNVNGWVEQNKDTVHQDISDAMSFSKSAILRLLFPSAAKQTSGAAPSRQKMQHTLVQSLRRDVTHLMSRLHSRRHSFIRCILPNRNKQAWTVDAPVLREQIAHMGLLESAAIRSSMNYKIKMSYENFAERYKLCCEETWPSWRSKGMTAQQACEQILAFNGIQEGSDYVLGRTKLFLTSQAVLLAMDDILEKMKDTMASIIQHQYRRYRTRKALREYKSLSDALAAANIHVDTTEQVSPQVEQAATSPVSEPGREEKKQEEKSRPTGGELRHREKAMRLREVDPQTQAVNSDHVLVILSDANMCIMEAQTLQLQDVVGYKDGIDRVCVSPIGDNLVLFKILPTQGQAQDDILLEVEDKDSFVKILKSIVPDLKVEVSDEFVWSKARSAPSAPQRDAKLFFKPTQRFQQKKQGLKVDGKDLIISAQKSSDVYGGKKLRRMDSFLRKCHGDYVRLTGSPLQKTLQRDHGDSKIVFSAVCSVYPTKLMQKLERIIMVSDKALYTLDPKGYMVNKRIQLDKIQRVEVSPAHDDFLLIRVLDDDSCLLIESSKKTELLEQLSDMYRKALKSNLEVLVTDMLRAKLAGGDLVEISFHEDPETVHPQVIKINQEASKSSGNTIVDIYLKPPEIVKTNKDGSRVAIINVNTTEQQSILELGREETAVPTLHIGQVKTTVSETVVVEPKSTEMVEEDMAISSINIESVSEPILQDIYGGRKFRRKMSLSAWRQGDYLHFRQNPQFQSKILEGKLGAPKAKVHFSGLVSKINSHYKAQPRRLVVTDSHLLSLDPDSLTLKTCLDIKDIGQLSVSTMRDGFVVLHLEGAPNKAGSGSGDETKDFLIESHNKTEFIEILRDRFSVVLPNKDPLPVVVDDTITYHPKNPSSVAVIQLRHDPLVRMPVLLPTSNGLLIRVNNHDGPASTLLSMDDETARKEMLRRHDENFAGLKDVSKLGQMLYGGKKGRRRESMKRQFVGDYLRLDADPRWKKVMDRNGDNKVLFSACMFKYNKQNKKQDRALIVTDEAIYNIEEVENMRVKRRIPLDEIEGVSVSELADNIVVLHFPDSYDYIFETDKKTELIQVLQQARKLSPEPFKINVADKFEYTPRPGENSSVQFVMDDAKDSTWIESSQSGLIVHVSNKQPTVTLEAAFIHIKDNPQPIEVFKEPTFIRLKKHQIYKLEIRFYVNEDLPSGCKFHEKNDSVTKRTQTTTPINALKAREERYVVTLPERAVTYSVLSKSRVKCKLIDNHGNILLSIRYVYDCS